jgi:signal transduction histidine kinase
MLQASSDVLRLARLASTGRLALVYALELRRLLGLAWGSMAAVEQSIPGAAQMRDALGSASDITRRLLIAAQRPTATEVIDLGDLVEEIHDLFGIIAGPGAVVVIVRDSARVRTLANRGDLEQILVNLIETRCDTAAGPRRITITSGIIDSPAWATLAGARLGGTCALLSVVDDQRTHVTSPRSTCARCGAVPALGLPLVQAIASAHNGAVRVQPGADGGVEYRVLLPLAPS